MNIYRDFAIFALLAILFSNIQPYPGWGYSELVGYLWPALVMLVIALSFVAQGPQFRLPKTLVLWGAALIGMSLISVAFSVYPAISLKRTAQLGIGVALMCSLAVVQDVQRALKLIATVSLAVGVFLSVIGLLMLYTPSYVTSWGTARAFWLDISGWTLGQIVHYEAQLPRISSLTDNPNRLAMTLSVSMLSSFYLLQSVKKYRSIVTISGIIVFIGLLSTLSRGSILALLLPFILLIGWRNSVIVALLGACVCIASIIALAYFQTPVLEALLQRLNRGAYGRDEMWSLALDALSVNAIIGVGFGVSQEVILDPEGIGFSMHSSYLSLLSEMGILGFSVFLMFIFIVFLKMRENILYKTPMLIS